MNGFFPKLEVVPIKKLVLHEKEDEERAGRLAAKMRTDGYFKNPVIVAKFNNGESKFLVLDGVHRITVLKALGCRDIVAQIVDYFAPDIKVYTWDHFLFGCPQKELFGKIRQLGEIKLAKMKEKRAKKLLKEKKILGYFIFKGGETFAINFDKEGAMRTAFSSSPSPSARVFKERTEKLIAVIGACRQVAKVDRVLKSDIMPLLEKHKGAAGLIIPNYDKEEIMEAAKKRRVLPAGVTRHVIPNRIIGLDVDLSLLKNRAPLKDKNKALEKLIAQKIKEKRVRFYSESVFVFNE